MTRRNVGVALLLASIASPLQAQEQRGTGGGVRFLCEPEQWKNADQVEGAVDMIPLMVDDLRKTDMLLEALDDRAFNNRWVKDNREARLRMVIMRGIEAVGVWLIAGGADSTTVMDAVAGIVESSPVELVREYSFQELRVASRVCLVPNGG